jgi:hypothetical protein
MYTKRYCDHEEIIFCILTAVHILGHLSPEYEKWILECRPSVCAPHCRLNGGTDFVYVRYLRVRPSQICAW